MVNTRNIVLNMLLDTLEKDIPSHLVLNRVFEEQPLEYRDKTFINRLFTGTLETLVYLDYVMGAFSSTPVKKMKPVIRNILRLSIYQIRFMDGVPQHAAVSEAVKLTRKRGFQNLTGFVNGVLRSAADKADTLSLPEHVKANLPAWIYQLLEKQYGTAFARSYCDTVKQEKETYIRLIERGQTRQEILDSLQEEGITVQKAEGTEHAWKIQGFKDLPRIRAFQQGRIIMQDKSSVMAMELAASYIKDPRLILDVCAAPGGKSLLLADLFPFAQIISRDLREAKTRLIEENVKRLQVSNVQVQVWDTLQPDPDMTGKADAVIADLPCSGLGVIGRKPDILYRLKEEDISSLQTLQRQILQVVRDYVKPGGMLVYSTCTITREENSGNTEWLQKQGGFTLLQQRQFLPEQDHCDGFFVACFQRT